MKTRTTFFIRRSINLKKLGFSSYEEYLRSPLWSLIKASVLKRYPNCKRCRKPAQVVHHLNYSKNTLSGKHQRFLMALCFQCHEEISIYAKENNVHDHIATSCLVN